MEEINLRNYAYLGDAIWELHIRKKTILMTNNAQKLHKITTDHTLVSLLVKSGELTEEEAKDHPRKNVLMRALGATNTVEMDIFDVERDVDGILLCSDGLTNMLDDEQIAKVLVDEDISIEDRLKKLIVKCNNRGGTDNISIAYLKDGVKKWLQKGIK